MADEAIGGFLIDKLQQIQDQTPDSFSSDIEFIDAGTGGLSILHMISNRKKAVIIDCALMGTSAGTLKRFTAEEVESVKQLTNFSLHECDILKVLDIAIQLDQSPDETCFFGIEPETISPRLGLSQILLDNIDSYISQICHELNPAVR